MSRGTALAPLDDNKLKSEVTIITASSPQQPRKRTSSRRKTRSTVRQQTRSSTTSVSVSTKRRKTTTGATTVKRSITLQPASSSTKTTNTTIQARTRSDRSCKSKTSLISKFDNENKARSTEKEGKNSPSSSPRKRKSPPPSLEDEPPITIHQDDEQQLFPSPSTSVLRSHFPAHNNNDDDEGDNFFDSSIWSYNVSGHVHPRSLNAAPGKDDSKAAAAASAPQCPSSNPFFSSNISSSTASSTVSSSTWSSDDFDILGQLGKGKFGIVYAATEKQDSYDSDDEEDEREAVALKILHKQKVLQCTTAPRLLRREVEIQSRLKHDNILRLHGYFHDSSSVYLVLEPSESGDLYKNCMSSSLGSRRLSLKQSASYIQQVTSALEYLQKHHVSHRDIKPENLLLCGPNQENIKLCDFGWAVHAPPPRHHMRITLCGTPEYVPPEMLKYEGEDEDAPYTSSATKRNKKRRRKSSGISLSAQPRIRKKYDARFVDSWALGVLAYEMVQGKTPFYVSRHVQEELARSKGCQQHEVIFDKIKAFSSSEFGELTYDDLCASKGLKYEEEGEVFLDFVRGLMKKDPMKRMTMLEALSHPWIC